MSNNIQQLTQIQQWLTDVQNTIEHILEKVEHEDYIWNLRITDTILFEDAVEKFFDDIEAMRSVVDGSSFNWVERTTDYIKMFQDLKEIFSEEDRYLWTEFHKPDMRLIASHLRSINIDLTNTKGKDGKYLWQPSIEGFGTMMLSATDLSDGVGIEESEVVDAIETMNNDLTKAMYDIKCLEQVKFDVTCRLQKARETEDCLRTFIQKESDRIKGEAPVTDDKEPVHKPVFIRAFNNLSNTMFDIKCLENVKADSTSRLQKLQETEDRLRRLLKEESDRIKNNELLPAADLAIRVIDEVEAENEYIALTNKPIFKRALDGTFYHPSVQLPITKKPRTKSLLSVIRPTPLKRSAAWCTDMPCTNTWCTNVPLTDAERDMISPEVRERMDMELLKGSDRLSSSQFY